MKGCVQTFDQGEELGHFRGAQSAATTPTNQKEPVEVI